MASKRGRARTRRGKPKVAIVTSPMDAAHIIGATLIFDVDTVTIASPHKREAEFGRRIAALLMALASETSDAAARGDAKLRRLRQPLANIALALAVAAVDDRRLVEKVEHAAMKILQRRKEDLGEAHPLAGPHYDLPDEYNLAASKRLLLEVVETELRQLVSNQTGGRVRIKDEEFDEAIAKWARKAENELKSDTNSRIVRAAGRIQRALLVDEERFRRLFPKFTMSDIVLAKPKIAAVIDHLITRSAATAERVVLGIAYLFGLDARGRHGFFDKKLLAKWAKVNNGRMRST